MPRAAVHHAPAALFFIPLGRRYVVDHTTQIVAEQCSFCRKVRYWMGNAWSSWEAKLPQGVTCEYYNAATCDHGKCKKERNKFILGPLPR